ALRIPISGAAKYTAFFLEPNNMRSRTAQALVALVVFFCSLALASAQAANPRLGKWKLKQDAPPPALNIMTYEPFGNGGMKVTVESTNREGRKSTWTYN